MASNEREDELQSLRDEVERLLAAALVSDANHEAATRSAQMGHEAELTNMDSAVATRDVIGQAKGIIMASLGCSPDHAFALLVKQSQAENRKVVDIAAGITAQVQRSPKPA